MANAVPQKPVISTVSTIHGAPEGEMDALLLGRTRVSCFTRLFHFKNFSCLSSTAIHIFCKNI